MTDTPWLNPTEMRAWRAFLTASERVHAAIDAELKASSDMTLDDYDVLVHLSESPDQRLRMSDLSTALLHSKSRLSQRVDRLAKRGWVERVKCEHDARVTWTELTTSGKQAIEAAAPQHVRDVRTHFFDLLDPAQLDVIAENFEQLAAPPEQ